MTRHAVSSQRVVTPDGMRPATIVIDGDTIESVGDDPGTGIQVEDLGDLVLMPGLVDCHVHINEPGRTEWEGFTTATRAAAAGGVTTVVDMPLNCTPVTTTVAALQQKLAATAGQLQVDTGFWAGVVPGNAADLQPLARTGALGAKAFLCESGIDDFDWSREADLRSAMHELQAVGLPLLAHAEIDLGDQPGCSPGARSHRAWLDSRPARWELAAIELLIRLCRDTGCAVHVVHLSAAAALPMLAEARNAGLPITVETCPHYLCLSDERVPAGATQFKCAPPIRDEANRDALWHGLQAGTIDFVISDHSPCTPNLKRFDTGDFGDAWGGISSLSLGLANVWTEARRRGCQIEQVAEWMCTRPARFAGLGDRKGAITPGLDADFCAWDPAADFRVDESVLHFKHPISPYLGLTLSGAVRATWLRGAKIFDAGQQWFATPRGRPLLHRTPS